MIFKQWKQVIGLELPLKTQTRRPVLPRQYPIHERPGYAELPIEAVYHRRGRLKWQVGRTYAVQPSRGKKAIWYHPDHPCYGIDVWPDDEKVGGWKDIASGQGYLEARVRILKIWREKLQDISEEDAKAEGASLRELFGMDYIPGWQSLGDDRYFTEEQRVAGYRGAFASLWDSIYPKEHNWLDNNDIWALQFELG